MREDIILDENGDFPLEDKVLAGVQLNTPYGESDPQHVEDGIFSPKGGYKHRPTYGFGVNRFLNSEFSQSIESELSREMDTDGYSVNNGAVYPLSDGFNIDTRFIQPK